jgi:hypothetical protein
MVEEGDRLVVDGVPAALVELLELEGVDNVGEGDLGSAGVEFFADEGGALSGGLRVFGREGQQKVDADDYEDLPATVAAFLWLLCVLRHFHYTISHTLTYRTPFNNTLPIQTTSSHTGSFQLNHECIDS